MRDLITKPRNSAIVGILLVTPAVVLMSLLVLKIEPPFGAYVRSTSEGPDVVGALLALNLLVVLPLGALLLNFSLLMKAIHRGVRLLGNPANLAVVIVAIAIVFVLAGWIAADQYPCVVGVPNCD